MSQVAATKVKQKKEKDGFAGRFGVFECVEDSSGCKHRIDIRNREPETREERREIKHSRWIPEARLTPLLFKSMIILRGGAAR